ncbi:MAG TPA: hypothetical protein VH637_09780 [Streptosporangiaceae bacterium]|jgi:hypothetical protein
MIQHSAPSQPRPAGRGIPRARRWATGLAVAAIASLAGAPAALAGPLPPPGGAVTDPVPPPPPPAPAAAHLPLWAVVTIVAATVVLSVATTLITLSLEHRLRGRTPASAPGTPPGAPTRPATAEPPAGQGEILSSHQHLAGYDMHRADSR